MEQYIISIDQSTQGTKALLFDESGRRMGRKDLPHQQIISENGWVSHNPAEIYENTLAVVRELVTESKIDKSRLAGLGISNQRETTVAWNRATGEPVCDAIVWQCARAEQICQRKELLLQAEWIYRQTGLPLSPYFPAAKMAWILEHVPAAAALAKENQLCFGTVDSWLVYRLTNNREYRTDVSNASRTQLFNIHTLQWDETIAGLFQIPIAALPEVTDSDACFGYTDLGGFLDSWIPIHGVLGDSHAALFGQGCLSEGMIKATYGTGSSIMMNIGKAPAQSGHNLAASLAWKRNGEAWYVLEGNLNYTGAVITWLKDDLELISSPKETAALAKAAVLEDSVYLVPAFSGLGAPYWQPRARACLLGMDRRSGKKEIVRAALECIAYQITDILKAMEQDVKQPVSELRVDGGPTANDYLMQFQSDIAGIRVCVPQEEELSAIGAAYLAGIAMGIWSEKIFEKTKRICYAPKRSKEEAKAKYLGWQQAVSDVNAMAAQGEITQAEGDSPSAC